MAKNTLNTSGGNRSQFITFTDFGTQSDPRRPRDIRVCHIWF